MAWLATDKGGSERVYGKKPIRHIDMWIESETQFQLIQLPKGTIKKLIGHDLTWEDDPVELKG